MAGRTIDVVASGPPSPDPYDPAASAWALAGGLSAAGHSVRVVFPGPEAAELPAGLSGAAFSPVTPHVGSLRGEAELAREAARHLRPAAEVVVRDPAGLGPIGHHARPKSLVAFVRGLAAEELEAPAIAGGRAGFRSKVLRWGERRDVRHLEQEALREATLICCASEAVRARLGNAYGVDADRLRVLPAAVAAGPPLPDRAAARRAVGVPDDVPLVAVLTGGAIPADEEAAPALAAFARIRPIFPGSRVAVVGLARTSAAGGIALPNRDAATIAAATAAADLGLVLGPAPSANVGAVLAMRAGLACVAGPGVEVGPDAETGLVRANPTDVGELASHLAGLLADPAGRGALGGRGKAFAARFEPARLVTELERAGGLGVG